MSHIGAPNPENGRDVYQRREITWNSDGFFVHGSEKCIIEEKELFTASAECQWCSQYIMVALTTTENGV